MNIVDRLLNKITMYRVVLYGLGIIAVYTFILAFIGRLSYSPLDLFVTIVTLTFVCYFGNLLLAKLFRATVNAESSMITALILFFLLWPSSKTENVLIFVLAGVIAMSSKYIFAYKKKHIFNPAAIACVSLLFVQSGGAWWIATPALLPAALIVGFLIVRKVRKFTMFFTFSAVALIAFLIQAQIRNLDVMAEAYQFFTSFPVIFFGTVMLTEPLTTPPTRRLQILYAVLLGILFSYQGTLGPIILTTELVLIVGNIFSFVVSPKYKLYLKLISKQKIAKDTYEYSFNRPKAFHFKPGQYLEWTLPMLITDGRGNRRYFTIASSPTEETIKISVRHNELASSFKQHLSRLSQNQKIAAGQLTGDFTLPENSGKLVFIAGGIGITPFRSMTKYILDSNLKKEVTLFYANKSVEEIAYKELFAEASRKIGFKVVYILTEREAIPPGWAGERGRIDEQMLKKYIFGLKDRTYYLSGPNAMVESYKKLLKKLGVSSSSIRTDYFPGF